MPTWLWYEDGLNRAIARAAFADTLPDAITRRRSKGGPDGFIVTLFERNRRLIADLLLQGELAAHGLIDRAAIADAIGGRGPVAGYDFVRIMQLVDTEVWARGWSA